jgi:hypothetical protein
MAKKRSISIVTRRTRPAKGLLAQSAVPHRRCFVIMPFSEIAGLATEGDWTRIFERMIKPAVEGAGLGYACVRSNADIGNLLGQIIIELDTADVVIADLSGLNANVFYELGVRHVLRGRTILIAQDEQHIPFDLKSYAYHVYDWQRPDGIRAFRRDIKRLLQQMDQSKERNDNPVEDFLQGTSERLFFLHGSRMPTEPQRAAADTFMREYARILHSIERGEIPIPDAPGGYFSLFLKTIASNTTCEHVKVFASLRPLAIDNGFDKFSRAELFRGLTSAVTEKRITIEYIVFLTDAKVLMREDVQSLLNQYTTFAREVRVAFAKDFATGLIETERTILLLTDRHWAFTHTWSVHADVTHATQWISAEAYDDLAASYDRLRMQSRVWFPSRRKKREKREKRNTHTIP